jgi:hypothetical protein
VVPPSRSGGRAAPRPPQYGPRQHCAGNARLLAAPNRYLAAGSTAESCLLESADDGTTFAKDHPDHVADVRASVCDPGVGLGELRKSPLSGSAELDHHVTVRNRILVASAVLLGRRESEYGSEGAGYHVIQRYGGNVQGYYRLHGSRVSVTFYRGRVGELGFATPYYRTKGGFGVGSKIPLGPCHRTATNPCEHRWHGFIFNVRLKENPCNCWVKVGLGARSLPATATNYLKPWFFIHLHRGRVAGFYFALKYVD